MGISDLPLQIFCSFAPEDIDFCNQLHDHLRLLEWQNRLRLWHPRLIAAGTDWAREIDEQLAHASIILLLISPAFFASDYYYGVEMQQAMQRHKANQTRVIPILLRPVNWKDALFSSLSPLPQNEKPVTLWRNRDAAFVDIVAGLRRVTEELTHVSTNRSYTNTISGVWNIPYRRNSFFTGREELLKELHNRLTITKTAALTQAQAISGLGGIGKTQVAIEYAYRYYDEYRFVLWVRAATRDTIISDLVTISSLLHLLEINESDQIITIAAVKRWLEHHENWLLIMDNADDMEMIRDFLPIRSKGHILFTTRAQAVGIIAHSIEVDKMGLEEGALLLLRRAKIIAADASLQQTTKESQVNAEAIVLAMDGLPLALDQAGAYIDESGCGLSAYLDLYQKRRSKLLKWRGRFASDYPESVTTIFTLSFEKIKKVNPAAADLLRLCAFLYPDAIPEEIIVKGAPDLGPRLRSVAVDPFKLDLAINALRIFSLVRRDPDAKVLNIHRLVQAVLRDIMDKRTQRNWSERTVRAVNNAFPNVNATTWPLCKRCLPQAQACVDLIENQGFRFPEVATLLDKVVRYLSDHALYTEAEPLCQRALAIKEEIFDPDHLEIAVTLHNQARLYHSQGRYTEAELLFQRALTIREKVLGPDHLFTAKTLEHYASLLRQINRTQEATAFEVRAKAIRIKQRL